MNAPTVMFLFAGAQVIATIFFFLFRIAKMSRLASSRLLFANLFSLGAATLLMWMFVANDYYTIGLLVAILIAPVWLFLLLASLFTAIGLLVSRKNSAANDGAGSEGAPSESRKKVRGWLLIICLFFIYLAPHTAIYSVYGGYSTIKYYYANVAHGELLEKLFVYGTCFFVAYAIFVGCILISGVKNSVRFAYSYIAISAICYPSAPYLWLVEERIRSALPGRFPYLSIKEILVNYSNTTLFFNSLMALALVVYLLRSRQVRDVYS